MVEMILTAQSKLKTQNKTPTHEKDLTLANVVERKMATTNNRQQQQEKARRRNVATKRR
jgi:hypothetical protein